MKIAFITFEYPPSAIGGAGVYASNLTRELVKLGNEVVVFTPEIDIPETDVTNGLRVYRVKVNRRLPLISVQFWMNLPKALEMVHSVNKFDVVHVNGTSYWFLTGKIINVPHIVTIHHLSRDAKGDGLSGNSTGFQLVGESSIVYQYLESMCVKFADRIIAVSKFTKGRIIDTYNIPVNIIEVIYNGFTPLRTDISNDEIVNFKKRFGLCLRPIILFVGRIDDPRKGLDVLLDAFSMVSRKVNAQLLIVGKGDKRGVLKKAQELGISANIIIAGFLKLDDLACSYSICDIYVCPSAMEGFGLTLLEAINHRKKIIATNVGAIPEVSNDSVTLFESSNHIELANLILQQFENPVPSSDTCQAHLSLFSWLEAATQTELVYKKIHSK
ncbi:MAG: glycosyltransferase family 4 protein [Methanomassiliicoccales archaeon]